MQTTFKSLIQDFKKKDFLAGWKQDQSVGQISKGGCCFGARIAELYKLNVKDSSDDYVTGKKWFLKRIKDEVGLEEWEVNLLFFQAGASPNCFGTREWKNPASEVFENLEKIETLDFSNFEKADLSGAFLRGANLENANFESANLENVILADANLEGANLRHANLEVANLIGANLRDAMLSGANLRHANLGDANLRDAVLVDANLEGADLTGVNLKDTVFCRYNRR